MVELRSYMDRNSASAEGWGPRDRVGASRRRALRRVDAFPFETYDAQALFRGSFRDSFEA
jgi:hypothetical protein